MSVLQEIGRYVYPVFAEAFWFAGGFLAGVVGTTLGVGQTYGGQAFLSFLMVGPACGVASALVALKCQRNNVNFFQRVGICGSFNVGQLVATFLLFGGGKDILAARRRRKRSQREQNGL